MSSVRCSRLLRWVPLSIVPLHLGSRDVVHVASARHAFRVCEPSRLLSAGRRERGAYASQDERALDGP
jgi:hypothetical protein